MHFCGKIGKLPVQTFLQSRAVCWPQGHKTFFMLNSAEHEICPGNNLKLLTTTSSFLLNIAEHENVSANKYENANYRWHFHIY